MRRSGLRVRTLMLLVALAAVATPLGQRWHHHAALLDVQVDSDRPDRAAYSREVVLALGDAARCEASMLASRFYSPRLPAPALWQCGVSSTYLPRRKPSWSTRFENFRIERDDAIRRATVALARAEQAASDLSRHRSVRFRVRTFFLGD